MSLILIIGVIAAVWVYRDAQKFGHTRTFALLWAVGTIVFFFVFFPLYLLLGRKPQMKQNKKIDSVTIEAEGEFTAVNLQDCPMCARKVEENFNVCPYCGYTLKLKCENCGEALKREWKVCPNCQTQTPEK